MHDIHEVGSSGVFPWNTSAASHGSRRAKAMACVNKESDGAALADGPTVANHATAATADGPTVANPATAATADGTTVANPEAATDDGPTVADPATAATTTDGGNNKEADDAWWTPSMWHDTWQGWQGWQQTGSHSADVGWQRRLLDDSVGDHERQDGHPEAASSVRPHRLVSLKSSLLSLPPGLLPETARATVAEIGRRSPDPKGTPKPNLQPWRDWAGQGRKERSRVHRPGKASSSRWMQKTRNKPDQKDKGAISSGGGKGGLDQFQ